MASKKEPIGLELSEETRKAIETLSGGRGVRLSGRVVGGRLMVDFVACNAPFTAPTDQAFTACNAVVFEPGKRKK